MIMKGRQRKGVHCNEGGIQRVISIYSIQFYLDIYCRKCANKQATTTSITSFIDDAINNRDHIEY
jgi:hypothetical protein